jgi:hypothetical protein
MENTELQIIEELEEWGRPTVTLVEAAEGKYPCLTHSSSRASFWICSEGDGVDIDLCVWSSFPYPYPDEKAIEELKICPQHNIDIEIENSGLFELLNGGYVPYDEFNVTNWLMANGLAPGQPFRVDAEAVYTSSYDYWGGGYEWDMDFEWEIVEKRPLTEDGLTPEQAWLRWADELPGLPLANFKE